MGLQRENSARAQLLLEFLHDDRGVVTAETQGIGHDNINFGPARDIRHVIQVTAGVRRFVVDGRRNKPITDGKNAGGELNPAGGPEQMPGHGLSGTHRDLPGVFAEYFLDRQSFDLVIELGRSAVGVNIGNIFGRQPRVFDGQFHRLGSAPARGFRRGNMKSVRGASVTDHLRQDRRAAALGMFQSFQDHDPRPFGHDKAVTVQVERARRLFRRVVAPAQRLERAESADAHNSCGTFRTPGDHHVRVAVLDKPKRVADGVRCR